MYVLCDLLALVVIIAYRPRGVYKLLYAAGQYWSVLTNLTNGKLVV